MKATPRVLVAIMVLTPPARAQEQETSVLKDGSTLPATEGGQAQPESPTSVDPAITDTQNEAVPAPSVQQDKAARTFIPASLEVPPFTPPVPPPRKVVQPIRIDASVTVLTKNSRTLTIQRGEPSTKPPRPNLHPAPSSRQPLPARHPTRQAMNPILRRLLPSVLLLGLVLTAPADGDTESLEFVSPPTGGLFLCWHAVAGRTYFVQVSYEPEPLATWTFAPAIENGDDTPIQYELDEPDGGFPDKGFFRPKYTDQELAPGETVDTADFDGDGISNKNEVDPPNGLAPTDPLNPDTDGDGLGRVRAIANNGVILGRAAIWRNGQSIALDTLVENQKVSGPTSATRYTNLEGLAMNGEGAIVATADDQLNSGDGHKTLILLLPVELTATPGKVHLGFDPPNKPENDSPDVYWASVVQGKDNNILHLRIPLPEFVKWRIDPSDEAMVDILPKTFAKETTDLTLKGKGNDAAAVETTINLVRRDQINTVLLTLKVLVLPQREKQLAIYRLEDPGAPRTQFAQSPVVDLPTDDEIVAACNDCFDQAGVHFTLHSSSGSYQFPYDTRGLTLEAGYSSEFPLRASDGKLTADEKQALMESYTPLNGQERKPAADDIFPVKTGDIETFRMILIKESGLPYGTDHPGQMIRGFAGTGLFARNLQQKTQISLATAHEAGHILKISTKDNEPGSSGHHQPPFSAVVNQDQPNGNAPIYPGASPFKYKPDPNHALMQSGTPESDGLPWVYGQWMRQEDWQNANDKAGGIIR